MSKYTELAEEYIKLKINGIKWQESDVWGIGIRNFASYLDSLPKEESKCPNCNADLCGLKPEQCVCQGSPKPSKPKIERIDLKKYIDNYKNIYELLGFITAEIQVKINELIDAYNKLI